MSSKTKSVKNSIIDGMNRTTGEDLMEDSSTNLSDFKPSAKKLQNFPVKEIQVGKNVRVDYNKDKIKELAESIRDKGLLQPIRISETKNQNGKHELISGRRRFKACTEILKWDYIPVVLGSVDGSELNRIQDQLIENIQREDLTDSELADSILELKKQTGKTNLELSKILFKTESWVRDKINHAEIKTSIKGEGSSTNLPLNKNELDDLPSSFYKEVSALPKNSQAKLLTKAAEKNLTQKELRNLASEEKQKLKLSKPPSSSSKTSQNQSSTVSKSSPNPTKKAQIIKALKMEKNRLEKELGKVLQKLKKLGV